MPASISLPPPPAFPGCALPGPLALTRSFGPRQLVLRVPEGDGFELEPAAQAVLRRALAGETENAFAAAASVPRESRPAETAALAEQVLAPFRDRLERFTGTGLAGDRAEPRFVSPAWRPPAEFPGGAFASLPRRRGWLLLVAATARAPDASAAWHTWLAIAPRPKSETLRRLRPLIAANLAAHGDTSVDAEAGARRAWLDNATGLQRLAPVLAALDEAGIRSAVIKGLAAAVFDYRDLALRPMNDFDLAVPLADRRRAIAVLEAAGFQAHSPCPEAFAHRSHGGAYVRPGHLNLDLHWHALWCNCWSGADDRFWADARRIELAGAPCHVPSAEFRFLMTCAHGLRHAELPAHYWIADAAMLLSTHGAALDWDRLLAEARARRLTRMLREACGHLATALGAPIPPEALRAQRRAPTAAFENLIFTSFQRRRPGRGAASRAVASWLNQYRVGARGFRPAEIRDFLRYVRLSRGGRPRSRFLRHLAARACVKAARELRARCARALRRLRR